MRWSLETRIIYLMNAVGWKDFEEWDTCIPTITHSHIPSFLEWFYAHLIYIKEERVRDALLEYYELGHTYPQRTGFNQALERGRIALTALYNMEQGKSYGRPEHSYFSNGTSQE